LATGEIFSAVQAEERGLVDRIGFVEDAIARAIELANFSPEQVRVVTYKQPLTLLSALTSMRATGHPWEELASQLAVPRAYYLMTSLPVAARLPALAD
jgi:protease-4